jgi:glyoxylase-like metal-dependent hydrolase (beta-lactamase superfamily II)
MGAYMASLDRLLARDDRSYFPAHGPPIGDPHAHVQRLIEHRRMRERQILAQLEAGETRIEAMVPVLYRDIDPRLHPAAARSVLAHLLDLAGRRRVRSAGDEWTLA